MKAYLNIGILQDYEPEWCINIVNYFRGKIINIINKNFINININEINITKLNERDVECDIIVYTEYCIWKYTLDNNIELTKNNVNNFFKKFKGTPIFISHWIEYNNWPFEHDPNKSTFEIFNDHPNVYTLSFNDDNDHNSYIPYIYTCFDGIYNNINCNNNENILKEKQKFCAYVTSNINNIKAHIYNLISNNIYHIDHYGKWKDNNNLNTNLKLDEYESYNILKNYKFILCIENTYSESNPAYITEKIARGYMNNCVPIYWGCSNITNIFNEKSFINITNLTDKEILEIINYYNENDNEYLKMLNEYPFKNKNINYVNFFNKNEEIFITKVLKKIIY